MFEYDSDKSAANLAKHGIDFEQAQAIWDDLCMTLVTTPYPDEERWLATGIIDGRHWTAIYTPREDQIRIISVRRSRPKEIENYET